MAAIPIYIIGTITTKSPKSGEVSGSGIEQCVISGLASIEGLGVGGGPVLPPSVPPTDAHPEHPIYYPPGSLPHPEHPIAGPPPSVWPTPPLRPAHPIVLPPDRPTDPPVEPPTQPPSQNWEWGWDRQNGWHPVYVPGDKPSPPPV